ncbi:MAG: tannase/feruloyl esterase family alpha/beta hydrolase [Acidimicrobiia bacterium]
MGQLQEAAEGYVPRDSFFGTPYVDVDEQRQTPVPHRYVHGGFADTATRFSFSFPDSYDGRFFHFLDGGYGGNENTSVAHGAVFGSLSFAASRGGYFVESNQGHIGAETCPKAGDDATVYAYRANAECTLLSRHLAEAIYGRAPEHGYVFGGSGGGHRTLCAMEYVEETDVWDAGVASVIGSPDTFRAYSVMNNARRLLGDRFAHVVDAVEPGGSGDPFQHLDTEARQALSDLYATGFPRGAERSVPDGVNAGVALWTWNADSIIAREKEYFDAFWTEPGHAGADGVLDQGVIDVKTTVDKVLTPSEAEDYPFTGFGRMFTLAAADKKIAIVLAGDTIDRIEGSRITVTSGAAAGRSLYCTTSAGGAIVGSSIGEAQTLLFDGVEPGDEVHVDNRDFLAYCYYYRHHATPEVARRLFIDGRAIYPQYQGGSMTEFSSPVFGPVDRTGAINHPLFVLQHTHDTSGWPAGGVATEEQVRAHLGDRTDSMFRMWWVDNAEHVPGSRIASSTRPVPSTRLVDYGGAHEAALDAMVAWIEHDVAPPASTAYVFDRDDNAVRLPATATERGGIQPVAVATANGAARADVAVGEEVALVVEAAAAPGSGAIVEVAWDFDGSGSWPEVEAPKPQQSVRHETRHSFAEPGTYFASARITSHPSGDPDDPHARVTNFGRCRIVVQ